MCNLQITPTEQGLREVTRMVTIFPQAFLSWMGPIDPVIFLWHPDVVRSVLNAPGTRWNFTRAAVHPVLVPGHISLFSLSHVPASFTHSLISHSHSPTSSVICPYPDLASGVPKAQI